MAISGGEVNGWGVSPPLGSGSDQFTDADAGDEAQEWEVVSSPVTFKKGHEVRARVQRPGRPETDREQDWPSHVRIQVRRWTAAPSRPTPEPVVGDDVEALRKELRRLRGENLRLEEDKAELEKRIAFMQRELEQTRAKVPS